MVSYKFIDPSEIAQLYQSDLEPGRDFQVVDVRDEDRIGGHLPGSMRAPSEQRTSQSVQDLVTKLEGEFMHCGSEERALAEEFDSYWFAVPKVIFHCTLSQVRGPKAASLYCAVLNERQEALQGGSTTLEPTSETSGDSVVTPTRDPAAQRWRHETSLRTRTRTTSRTPSSEEKGSQEVWVLRGGFGEWQRMYKDNPKLIEGFDPSIWSEGEH